MSPAVRERVRTLPALLAGFADAVPAVDISGVELDSRRVAAGDLFLACRSAGAASARHGLAHVGQALQRGAAAVAWEPAPGWDEPDIGIPQIAVPALHEHAGEIAARFFAQPSTQMFCIGVTGTDGKTSTAYLIAQALDALGVPCAYLGTIGAGRIGALDRSTHTTPDAVSVQKWLATMHADGVQACAMEVSSHALDQHRIGGVALRTAVLTNITRDHLDYHGTVEAYAAAKRRLFERDSLTTRVLNRDDGYGAAWAAQMPGDDLLVYGIDGERPDGRHLIARNLRLDTQGLSFDIDSHLGSAQLRSALLGRFNVHNLLAALGALLSRGFALDTAVEALARAHTVPGRIEGFRGPLASPLVVVDYAHTPAALRQVLQAARAHTRGALHVVFGCGGDRDRGKRPLMGAAALELADRITITDDNPRSESPQAIVAEILSGIALQIPKAALPQVVHDRRAAIAAAIAAAGPDDIVVVAGKGHEDYQIYGSETRAFSDRALVAELLGTTVRT